MASQILRILSGFRVWKTSWNPNRLSKISAETPWGLVPFATEGACKRHAYDTHDAFMIAHAGMTQQNFESWTCQTYRRVATSFCDPEEDFVNSGLTSPMLSRVLNEQRAVLKKSGLRPTLKVTSIVSSLIDIRVEDGAADCEQKLFGIWSPAELNYHLRAGADGPEAAIGNEMEGRFGLQHLVATVVFDVEEAWAVDAQRSSDALEMAQQVEEHSAHATLLQLHQRIAVLREQLHSSTLSLAEKTALSKELASVSSSIQRMGPPARQPQLQSGATTAAVRHARHLWEFEADLPKLHRGELPTWRVRNINGAIQVP
eukprot:m.128623 g.128623  ORF g.128623 m.128623 type:complete len:315 (+) comp17434_c0_seq1:591-1535(+)